MYYVGKLAQAAGLTIILFGFIKKFPNLMSHGELLIGMAVFAFGWIIDTFLIKR